MEFTIRIAGLAVRVCHGFESTRFYCRNYLTREPETATISVSGEDLAAEQEALRQEAIREGLRTRVFPEPFLERSVIQRKLSYLLHRKGVLLFHGSLVAVDGEGYLFTAHCGTGKSTHTRLWRACFGERAVMVNDDKPFLEITDSGVLAHGSPWSGKHGLDTNVTVPLKAICILERGQENRIWKITAEEALEMLQAQAAEPEHTAEMPRHRELVRDLSRRVGLYRMRCNQEPEAALTAYGGMQPERG